MSFDEKELLAFDVVDFVPVNRDGTGSVVQTDSKSVRVEAFDFTCEAVSIAHDEKIRLIASGQRQGDEQ